MTTAVPLRKKPAVPPAPRRIGREDSAAREAILDATEAVLRDEGDAALSSRRVAEVAGLKQQLVYYYFRTMDELLLAVFRRFAERFLDRQAQALASPRPLTALWELYTDASVAVIVVEFLALANHRAAVRDEIAGATERFRVGQIDELGKAMQRVGLDTEAYPPSAIVMLMLTISTTMKMESGLGVEHGYAELMDLVRRHIDKVEGSVAPA